MSMSKKDFIELADLIRWHNQDQSLRDNPQPFTPFQIKLLSEFCKRQNSNFMSGRWTDYIAGECGPSGGAVKRDKAA